MSTHLCPQLNAQCHSIYMRVTHHSSHYASFYFKEENCSTNVLHACTERDRFDMTKTRYNQKYKYDLNQNRWPLKVKHSNSIWLMGVKPQTAPFSFLWVRNAAEMLPQLWCSTLPSQCVSVFPMHIIRHLKGKQCIFTRHASLCAQTGAISAETGGGGVL